MARPALVVDMTKVVLLTLVLQVYLARALPVANPALDINIAAPSCGIDIEIDPTATPEISVSYSQVSDGCVVIFPSATGTPDTTGTIATSLPTSYQAYTTAVATTQTSSTLVSVAPNSPLTPSSTSGGATSLVVSSVASSQQSAMSSSATSSGGAFYAQTSSANTASSQTPTYSNATSGADIFQPIATGALPANIPVRSDHPVARLGIQAQNNPRATNKFYANLFLGTQTQPVWTHPYSLAWAAGSGNAQSYGLAISHIEASQRAYGPTTGADNATLYFINPIGIQSVIMSAAELGSSTSLTTDTLLSFSVNLNLSPSNGSSPAITFPLVQGMGFVTGIYHGSTPVIQSSVFFTTVTRVTTAPTGTIKYRISLEDGTSWLLYAVPADGVSDLSLQAISNSQVQATGTFNGTIHVAKNPGGDAGEAIYDASAGVYATQTHISGTVSGSTGSYTLQWLKQGLTSNTLLMFALPHHIQTLDSTTAAGTTSVQLQTTTKGVATAIKADSWTLVEPSLPTDLGFAPWSPTTGSVTSLSSTAQQAVSSVGATEITEDMLAAANVGSMYYGGKALAKFAMMVYALHDLAGDTTTAATGLANLKQAFALFVNNQQQYGLTYETAWGGVVSNASYATGDSGADFGNTYYNDHHFHYGYYIYTAAVIGYLDPTWISANKDYVNMLVRDVANPSLSDNYFPFSRMFDWYHGHSWAHGLYEVADGKDEESTSEDALHVYGIKMWGQIVGDANMEARGNLMLSVLARSLQNYFLYQSDNTVQPSNFIPNKVSGILFENKIDHTTYFGTNNEYIEGIHMIPPNPSSALTRTKEFVTEEWATYFDSGRVDQIDSGWKGILYANYAIVDPATSYNFFAQSGFSSTWLDDGASRTWYLAYSAGLGGA